MPFFHRIKIDVPKNTSSDNPVTASKRLRGGSVITRGILHVPSGPEGLAPVWIRKGASQLIPTDPADVIDIDDVDLTVIGRNEFLEMKTTNDIVLAGYNDDDAYDHTAQLFIRGLLPTEVPEGGVESLYPGLTNVTVDRGLF